MSIHKHQFSRSRPNATVETCTCGKFRHTEYAGEPIVEQATERTQAEVLRAELLFPGNARKIIEACDNYEQVKQLNADLLSALKELSAMAFDDDISDDELERAVVTAKAAIARAEGEKPRKLAAGFEALDANLEGKGN